jgi:hypothetical protein
LNGNLNDVRQKTKNKATLVLSLTSSYLDRATLGKPEAKASLQRSTLRFVGMHDASGKSLSWFLFSPDMRYCCKTATDTEADLLLRILPSYESHCAATAVTLLPRFLGLYRASVGRRRVWILVQGNVFAAGLPIAERYDLKGSWAGRSASARELAKGSRAVLKDRDFVARGRALACADPAAHAALETALQRDCAFLRAHGLIDYSLLVGLVARADSPDPSGGGGGGDRTAARHGVMTVELADPAMRLAVVGLVDILMEYGWFKRLENLLLDPVRPGLSCAPPARYAGRMLAFAGFAAHPGPDPGPARARERAAWLSRAGGGGGASEFGRKDALAWAPAAAAVALAVTAAVWALRRRG